MPHHPSHSFLHNRVYDVMVGYVTWQYNYVSQVTTLLRGVLVSWGVNCTAGYFISNSKQAQVGAAATQWDEVNFVTIYKMT